MSGVKEKEFDPNCRELEANGKTYYRHDSLTIVRWKKWLKLQHKLGWGMTFEEIQKEFRKIYDVCNKPTPEPGMACILAYNAMVKVKDVQDERWVPEIIQMCALFWNLKDEDLGDITEAQIREKEKDWEIEGIPINFFFAFALAQIPNFIPIYKAVTQDIFPNPPKESQEAEGVTG